jgi:hypothetical protein
MATLNVPLAAVMICAEAPIVKVKSAVLESVPSLALTVMG